MANEILDNQDASLDGTRPHRKPRYLLWYSGLGSLVLVAIVLAFTLGGGSSVQAAPNFPFTLYQGESELGASNLDLADLGGKPVVLNFWAELCGPCRAEMPDLQLFHEDFKDKVTLIGIDLGQYKYEFQGTHNSAQTFLNQLEITYPAGFTDDASVVRKYEVLGMPTTVFINSKGDIFRTWGGFLNLEILTDVTNEMLALESS